MACGSTRNRTASFAGTYGAIRKMAVDAIRREEQGTGDSIGGFCQLWQATFYPARPRRKLLRDRTNVLCRVHFEVLGDRGIGVIARKFDGGLVRRWFLKQPIM